MSTARALVVVGIVGLAAYAVAAHARQQPAGEGDETPFFWPNLGGAVEDDIGQEITNLADETDYLSRIITMPTYSGDANASAFLEAIKRCEGTAGQSDPYRTCYAYKHVVRSFADHPAVTGEWRGERLSDTQCAGAGYGPGCVSSAAGAYQIIRGTWINLRDRLRLPDFSPASQDAAAIQLLKDCGAYARLQAGDLTGAIAKARRTWASLPGAGYAGQGMRSAQQVAAWYSQAGGAVA